MFDADTTIRELRIENRPKINPKGRGDLVRRLAGHIDEQSACSACYAALIFALHQTGTRSLQKKIRIGQGFRGKKCGGIGVGDCAAGCERHVRGCPPTAADITSWLFSIN